ncbi:sugar 3,4-ketoisomerase [Glaciecola punicea]|jgi:dTDP-4-dehydrorhamnose 3,5-epimerase-like enzyme|nr:FdtA/QdtA family cupin domain-containing protein [Glaciecola punicea]
MSSWNIVEISSFPDERGNIHIAEYDKDFDFNVKRIYYLTGMSEKTSRGGHAHVELNQFMLCLAGSFDIELNDGILKQKFRMKNDSKALCVGSLVWRDMTNFTADAVMLVLNDRVYSEDRVVRCYSTFEKLVYEKNV